MDADRRRQAEAKMYDHFHLNPYCLTGDFLRLGLNYVQIDDVLRDWEKHGWLSSRLEGGAKLYWVTVEGNKRLSELYRSFQAATGFEAIVAQVREELTERGQTIGLDRPVGDKKRQLPLMVGGREAGYYQVTLVGSDAQVDFYLDGVIQPQLSYMWAVEPDAN